MWSVSTIITGLISFMAESAPTLGSIETSLSQKKKFARQSLDYNTKDPTFSKLFPHLVKLHKERLERMEEMGISTKSSTVTMTNGGSGDGNGNELQSIMAVCAGLVALLSILFAMRIF